MLFTVFRQDTHELLIRRKRSSHLEIKLEVGQADQIGDSRGKVIIVKPPPTGYTLVVVVQDPLQTLDIAKDELTQFGRLVVVDL